MVDPILEPARVANDNDVAAEGAASGESASSETTVPLLSELLRVVGDGVREIFGSSHLDPAADPAAVNPSPGIEPLSAADAAASMDRWLADWCARFDPRIADRLADLLVYRAALLLGRRARVHAGGVRDGAGHDSSCALEFLLRVREFSDRFGDEDDGDDGDDGDDAAARQHLLEHFAGPLRLVDDTGAFSGQRAREVVHDLSHELLAASWRDVVGLLLDLPIRVPCHPHPPRSWRHEIERDRLVRALTRGLADLLDDRDNGPGSGPDDSSPESTIGIVGRSPESHVGE